MAKEYQHLTPEEVDFFMENGYLVVKQAFSKEKAAEFTKDMWVRLGLDPNDPSTWDRERIHMPVHKREPVATFAPRVWEIMKELLGGEDRIDPASSAWGDSFIVNLGLPTLSASDPPCPPQTLDNWHVDGDFFVHFLDSPEQALLVIPLFSDIAPTGGATYIAPQGIDMIARYLAAHPEGVVPARLCFVPSTFAPLTDTPLSPEFVERAKSAPGYWSHLAAAQTIPSEGFVELTGETGDVVLLHPLMLHSASKNHLRVPRVITNPPVALRAPFCFAREDPGEYSLVERKTLRALGVERYEFARTGERRSVVPLRVGVQAKMLEEERRRLDEAAAVRKAGKAGTVEADAGARAVAIAVA
ncbi:hypothetical protein L226DRAFT_458432 [Lentinus tigrinus ALCF2SS1-7]|uniref:uncharacterized protein n=1 Tax=Lentinus tigrinus ALCF2SS1-7 TaxID=1328758 RepID=UPI0011662F7A|nr:hypothetical protein L226DRAFT_458432 [Lentinus tigrinus ALCF2SS1-7]